MVHLLTSQIYYPNFLYTHPSHSDNYCNKIQMFKCQHKKKWSAMKLGVTLRDFLRRRNSQIYFFFYLRISSIARKA